MTSRVPMGAVRCKCRAAGLVPILIFFLALRLTTAASGAETFSIGTYNLENYVDAANSNRPPKSEQARAAIRESIRSLSADVLGLQEIGSTNTLLELRSSLQMV